MNNLRDISLHDNYSEMFGYTKEEIEVNFKTHLEKLVQKTGFAYEELYEKIREYYNGFSFDGEHSVYNPFSMLNFLDEGKFLNFWFDTGLPSFIVEYIKKNNISVEDYRGYVVTPDFTGIDEIERAEPASLLFQAGHLTFKERFGSGYVLDYPNLEVLSATAKLVATYKLGLRHTFAELGLSLELAFDARDVSKIVECLNRTIAAIPFNLFENTEKFYHMALLIFMWGSRINTLAEEPTHRGRSDIVAMHAGTNYVIELKVASGEAAAKKAAQNALEQIKEKGYAQKYEGAVCLGFGVDTKARQIYCVRG